jgi:uncharacterized membrane protein YsdA (DUF1294 family)/cold shock CspA family protein
MRYQGKITEWRDEQGFGFITQHGDAQRYFLHIKSFARRGRRPVLNDVVTYTIGTDRKGRANAENVEFANQRGSKVTVRRETTLPLYFALAFMVLIATLPILGFLSWKILCFYVVVNVLTWFLYMFDKEAARKVGRRRRPENTLHLLSLVGGWPGALLAQRMFRHKSSKRSFQEVFWATVIFHCCVLAWLLSPYGQPVRAVLDTIAS